MSDLDWSKYQNFERLEFVCRETGECDMKESFMSTLQKIRTIYGKPMIISSGYRSIRHSREMSKDKAGEHSLGLAADILVSGNDALQLVDIAINQGVKRIGVNQKGEYSQRFLHLGIADRFGLFPPSVWSY